MAVKFSKDCWCGLPRTEMISRCNDTWTYLNHDAKPNLASEF